MPAEDIPLTEPNLIHLAVPDNFSIALLHVGKSEIYVRVTPDAAPATPAATAAPAPERPEIPADVLAWCDKKGIADDLAQALAIVRAEFPDLRNEAISLEEHEVLERTLQIQGEAPGPPEVLAQRHWDCLGRWARELSQDGFLHLRLSILPESE